MILPLKPKRDELHSSFAFNFDLRRYIKAMFHEFVDVMERWFPRLQGMAVQIDPMKPILNAPGSKRLKP